jgi:hypothetical protein
MHSEIEMKGNPLNLAFLSTSNLFQMRHPCIRQLREKQQRKRGGSLESKRNFMAFFELKTGTQSQQQVQTNCYLDGEDYHEFIFKQKKKLQITYKKRLAFAKPYQPKWISFEEETKDYWKLLLFPLIKRRRCCCIKHKEAHTSKKGQDILHEAIVVTSIPSQ